MTELSNLEKIVLGVIMAGLLVSAGWIPVKSYVMKKCQPHTQKVTQYPIVKDQQPIGGYGTPYYTSASNMAVTDKKMPKLTTGTNNTALGYQALKPKTTNGAEAVFYDGDSAHWWPKEESDGK